jgi:hypothetical protein
MGWRIAGEVKWGRRVWSWIITPVFLVLSQHIDLKTGVKLLNCPEPAGL